MAPSRDAQRAQPQWANERDLLDRLRSGDDAVFEAAFHTFHAPLCTFAYRYVHARDVAEELVQEVFLVLWERRAVLQVHSTLKSYLYGSVRNAALSYVRHEGVVARHAPEAEDLFMRPPATGDAELRVEELTLAIQRAVARLPERCRLIFTLHNEQGLTCREIAEVLELSPKTVETQIGRALKALRRRLAAFRD